MKENFIRISKEQFYNYFKGKNYIRVPWYGAPEGIPAPPFWMSHHDWVFDKTTQQYVGANRSSSWNDDVDYEILKELATPEMIEWYENYSAEEKKKQEEYTKEINNTYTKFPQKKFDPLKPGLMEFLESDNAIPYNPSDISVEHFAAAISAAWRDKPKTEV